MAFNSREYQWSDITLLLGGVDITGIRAIKYTRKREKEAIFAKGADAHSIQSGNNSVEGELEILQSDYDALVASSPDGSVLSLTLDALINFGNPPDVSKTDRLISISFTEEGVDTKQGDKFIPMKLPFIALKLQKNV